MDEAEELAILEEVARTGSSVARIQALKLRRKVLEAAREPGGVEPEEDGFGELDAHDEVAARRRARG